jgi:methyl-accepting chemotaxis protein
MAAIQGSTGSAVSKIADISKRIGDLDSLAAAIAAAAEQQGAATGDIARSIQEAATGSTQIAETIDDVRRVADENGRASGELLGACGTLNESSEALKSRMTEFVAGLKAS